LTSEVEIFKYGFTPSEAIGEDIPRMQGLPWVLACQGHYFRNALIQGLTLHLLTKGSWKSRILLRVFFFFSPLWWIFGIF
jgi:hypothetical protein